MKKILWVFLFSALCTIGFGFEFNRMPAGTIAGVRPSYVSGSVVKVSVGYGETMGSYWEITSADSLVITGYTLTGLSATANGVFHYLYIDRANSSFPGVVLKNSTTAPIWSSDFMGWYNGSDRCIGAVWVLASGVVGSFICTDETTYYSPHIQVVNGAPSSATWNWSSYSTFNAAAYLPVNMRAVRLNCLVLGSFSFCRLRVTPSENQSNMMEFAGSSIALLNGWIEVSRGFGGSFYWYAQSSSASSNSTSIAVTGYKIER